MGAIWLKSPSIPELQVVVEIHRDALNGLIVTELTGSRTDRKAPSVVTAKILEKTFSTRIVPKVCPFR